MSLTFVSHVPDDTIWIIFVYLDQSCEGNFRKEGWYGIGSGGSAEVWAGDCGKLNSYWYFFAESNDGLVWEGKVAEIEISTPDKFDQCVWDNTNTDQKVGLLEVNVGGYDDFTINLWGPAGPPHGGGGGPS
jgi:hypothetical protein